MKHLLVKIRNVGMQVSIACYVEDLSLKRDRNMDEFISIMSQAISKAIDKELPQKLCKGRGVKQKPLEILFVVNPQDDHHW
ncbi:MULTISPECIES: hypothetical protein [Cysteiniphilum]|uniref:Uncharacterized protein n=1 Tax=Cysteiniphilum litorale TaxID=2056700 RepID=A0A8J3EAG7_9GAMM|nr:MULTISPECIES: hypothetical protein [Cysteiniphilum]GGG08368.1 hypothetical protein GCM10010995_27390 [Cysteiniphilum litorale]